MTRRIKTIIALTGLSVASIISTNAFSAGYKMEFQSASVLADAGDAAVVEDAGTNWYNSAGLVNLPRQVVAGGMIVRPDTRIRATVFAPSPISPLLSFTGTGTAKSAHITELPLFHYSQPINPCFAVGLSIVPAWGFMEDYGRNSILRYSLTRIYSRTIDVSPSLAMRINPQLSFGIGPDAHYFYVSSRSNVRTEGPFPFGTVGDSVTRFSGDRWNFGAHAGLLYSFSPSTRIGLNYKTGILMHLKGRSTFHIDDSITLQDNDFRLDVPLPPVVALSAYHDINPCWAIMGTISYERWSRLNRYHAQNIIEPPNALDPDGIIPDIFIPQKMKNTWDFGVGTHYRWNDHLMLRANLKYLQTPTRAQYRFVNFPDAPKVGVQIGARYTINPCIAVDALYGHVFTSRVHINDVNPLSFATATGTAKTHIDLVGAQIVWNI